MFKWLENIFKKEKHPEEDVRKEVTPKVQARVIEYIHISNDWNADPVEPKIVLEVDGSNLIMDIYLNHYVFEEFEEGDKVKIEFSNCSKYSLNKCNDEGYYYGQYRTNPNELPWGEFYEIKNGVNTDFPEPIISIASNIKGERHFIFFFKDETFECLAKNYNLEFYNSQTNSIKEKKKSQFKVLISDQLIATSELENGDPPMGVAFGKLNFEMNSFGYNELKELLENNGVKIAEDDRSAKMLSTETSDKLRILNQYDVEIKGEGNQIIGAESEEFQISIFGIPYPFYEEEFPKLVKDYKERFKQ